jgi:hypothetical protein
MQLNLYFGNMHVELTGTSATTSSPAALHSRGTVSHAPRPVRPSARRRQLQVANCLQCASLKLQQLINLPKAGGSERQVCMRYTAPSTIMLHEGKHSVHVTATSAYSISALAGMLFLQQHKRSQAP